MALRSFSYKLEKDYYARSWPGEAKAYLHLESYLRCWLDPQIMFEGKRVLDIGAGECAYTRLIAELFRPKEIVACELFFERMQPSAQANQNLRLRFIAGDCFRLPFRSGSFDVVFGSLVLHQLPELDRAITEVRRVLSGRGCYIGIEPNPYHPAHLYRYMRGGHSPNQYLLGPKHLALFEKHGFSMTIRYFYAKFPRFKNRFVGTCMGIVAQRHEVEGT